MKHPLHLPSKLELTIIANLLIILSEAVKTPINPPQPVRQDRLRPSHPRHTGRQDEPTERTFFERRQVKETIVG
ncbi:MAG: hypothetical protein D6741_09325 [Planctomycetota bacterium]|nr:MAG: hypothetical protein D6741_09325 [Planctomycetota bacterium]